ncbi:MAG: EamA family transporter RarD [Pseudomonadota bacterium]
MNEDRDTPEGLAFAIGAYILWGFLPLYLKLVDHVAPVEVVAHRVIWSVPVAGAVLVALRRTDTLRAALKDPRALGWATVTAALISVNWGVYVYAIASEQTVQAALGYYINPLFSVLMGAIFLRERLDALQWFAIALAFCAVLVLTIEAGELPLIALILMLSFGFYALAKKQLPIGPNQGFLLEVMILAVPALAYIGWVEATGSGSFSLSPWLLLGCGIVTAVPLMLYANGAKRLKLSTIGILQYIAPTMILLIAVFLFQEPFGRARAIAFPMIWAALALYSVSLFRQVRRGTV